MTSRGRTVDIEIQGLGARGDGIATVGGERVYVPYTVPGDRLSVRLGADRRAEPLSRTADGPDRGPAACPHFTQCGGCAAQHLADPAYAAWKHGLVGTALARRGLDARVEPLFRTPPGARRRIRLSARVIGGRAVLGFRRSRGHRLVDIDACPVAAPSIVALIAPLRRLAREALAPGAAAEITVTLVDTGLDLSIETADEPDLAVRRTLAAFADAHDLARVSWTVAGGAPEPVAARRPARLTLGDGTIDLPPGVFVQPTAAGEAFLRARVLEALGTSRRVADLFCGMGAFGLPLALSDRTVFAADADKAALGAFAASARGSGVGERLTVEMRDLDRRPVPSRDLGRFDGVVLDPPRAGAVAQIAELARSAVPVIAYVSCNAATFARDARTLVDGGYRIGAVAPVDQFLWSPHVELAAVFRR